MEFQAVFRGCLANYLFKAQLVMVPPGPVRRKPDRLPNTVMESEKSNRIALDSLGRRKYSHIPNVYICTLGHPHSTVAIRWGWLGSQFPMRNCCFCVLDCGRCASNVGIQ